MHSFCYFLVFLDCPANISADKFQGDGSKFDLSQPGRFVSTGGNSWLTSVYLVDSIINGSGPIIGVTFKSTYGHMIFGINKEVGSNTDNHPAVTCDRQSQLLTKEKCHFEIDYGWCSRPGGIMEVWENGNQMYVDSVKFDVNAWHSIVIQDGNVHYLVGEKIVYTSTRLPSGSYHVQASVYDGGVQVEMKYVCSVGNLCLQNFVI